MKHTDTQMLDVYHTSTTDPVKESRAG